MSICQREPHFGEACQAMLYVYGKALGSVFDSGRLSLVGRMSPCGPPDGDIYGRDPRLGGQQRGIQAPCSVSPIRWCCDLHLKWHKIPKSIGWQGSCVLAESKILVRKLHLWVLSSRHIMLCTQCWRVDINKAWSRRSMSFPATSFHSSFF